MDKLGTKICSVYRVANGCIIISEKSGNVYTAAFSCDVGTICAGVTNGDLE